MSAIPQKKLCWNCDGNVSKEIDNCPYCGVYLHATELEENSNWNPSYSSSFGNFSSSIHSFEEVEQKTGVVEEKKPEKSFDWALLQKQLKEDLFPLLFLMSGSLFLLFGLVLIFFSKNGMLTLQWESRDACYFLCLGLPLISLGWKFFQRLDS